ncbi:hypothetical protein DY000_02033790 [Brassica cretica]|uniref:VAN3-binding protein-like auxin canalisation domain-containing protein n=1 Tax=Brassica cretica TaxID=69181 RepID=A0ABQ7DSR3_BRACR|nr:hypothetical protein DY000_02033790 [Brassica cretica]
MATGGGLVAASVAIRDFKMGLKPAGLTGAWTVEEQREAWTSGEQRGDKNAEENKRDWTASLRPPRRRPETGLLYCLAPPERR